MNVTLNETLQRFELWEDNQLAFADYTLMGGVLHIQHVEAHPALRGKGSAGRLMEGLLELVEGKGWRVVPVCGYAAAFIERHPAYAHLLHRE